MFIDPPHYKLNITTRAASKSILDCYKWNPRIKSYERNLRIRDKIHVLMKEMEKWRVHYKDQGFQIQCTVDWQNK